MKPIDFTSDWQFIRNGQAKPVSLPHDAMLEEARSPDSPGGSACAYFMPNTYVYEKTFTLTEPHNVLEFEGVYHNAKVFVNGKEAGGAPYGYIPFFIELDAFVTSGENTVRVEVDNSQMPNSRWYTGAGIYRPVWLHSGGLNAIAPESLKVTTLSIDPAKIRVEVDGDAAVQILFDGKQVAAGKGTQKIEIEIPDARLWSEFAPNLYTCRAALASGDVAETKFGIREVKWSNQGLFINGKNTLLRGGCVHHDNGILGAATHTQSEFRRVKMLKDAGFNAIRSSHNPASKAMLEACDFYGVYMIDETWDMWYQHKNKFDYASDFLANYKNDIKALVDRDYNHPSVIMYSIGNEMGDPAEDKGVALAKEMVAYFKGLDSTRAVTAGVNLMIINLAKKGKGIYKDDGTGAGNKSAETKKQKASGSLFFNMITSMVGTGMNKAANSKGADEATSPVLDALDIAGYNYASGRYPNEGKLHPDRIVYGSETFPQDIAKNWAMVKKYPYLIGDFMWTAWDYLGEAGIGAWSYDPGSSGFSKPYPWLLGDVGAFDILGNPNGELYLAQAAWGLLSNPKIAVQPVNHPGVRPSKSTWRGTNALPSWAWQNCEGNKAIVEVYTNADKIELLLNGKSLGKKAVKGCVAKFKTKYAPGTLIAVAYDAAGRKTGESRLESATGQPKISVVPEVETARPGQVVYLNINLTGENGVVEMNTDTQVTLAVENGQLLAFGSANPRTEETYQSGSFTTYYGRAQAVVKCTGTGTITVTAAGNGVQSQASICVE